MAKCTNCRKADALETRWEKIRYWVATHLFPQDFIDARANSFTQGFGDGYKLGGDHARENELLTRIMQSASRKPSPKPKVV